MTLKMPQSEFELFLEKLRAENPDKKVVVYHPLEIDGRSLWFAIESVEENEP